MKSYRKKSGNSFLSHGLPVIIFSMLAAFLLFSCGPSKEEKAKMEKLKEVKETATLELEKVSNDISDRIAYLDGEIEVATGELKQSLEEAKTVLIEQQNIVVKQINDIKDCCIDEWDQMIKNTSEILKNVRAKTSETSKTVRELLDD
jgi:hypothetical protein